MDIHHLRYFVVLSEELHFGRAAQRLHMAQPPLSQRIKSLEREVGMELFHRRRSGVEITEAGALLLEHARSVLDSFARAEESMRRIRPGAAGVVHMALPPDTMPAMLRVIVEEFSRREPDVLLSLHEHTTGEQIERLRDGELDVAVVRHPLSTVGFESGTVVSRPLGVVLPRTHRLADAAIVRLDELRGDPLVLFPRAMAPTLYDEIVHTCRDAGYLPAAIQHARNQSFVHGVVSAGRGVHLNEDPWSELPEGLVWRPIVGEPLHWRSSALWVASRRSSVTDSLVAAIDAGFAAAGHVVERPGVA